jgi:hypothetical protein
MSRIPSRLACLVLLLALLVPLPAVASPRPAIPHPAPAGLHAPASFQAFLTALWRRATSLWPDNGSGLDPYGHTIAVPIPAPGVTPDNGSGLDPYGGS